MSRNVVTSVPLIEELATRWSPRVFDADAVIDHEDVTAMLEAARWSPSANNLQPWRFIVGLRGSELFDTIFTNLKGFNQAWAHRSSALVVNVIDTRVPEGGSAKFYQYDLGQSVAHMTVQAQALGWFVHQVGGVSGPQLAEALGLEPHLEVFTVSAIGRPVDPTTVPDVTPELVSRETAPRVRKDLDEIVLKRD